MVTVLATPVPPKLTVLTVVVGLLPTFRLPALRRLPPFWMIRVLVPLPVVIVPPVPMTRLLPFDQKEPTPSTIPVFMAEELPMVLKPDANRPPLMMLIRFPMAPLATLTAWAFVR